MKKYTLFVHQLFQTIRPVHVFVNNLNLYDQHISNFKSEIYRNDKGWRVNLDSSTVGGYFYLPDTGDRAAVVNLDHMHYNTPLEKPADLDKEPSADLDKKPSAVLEKLDYYFLMNE